MLFVGKTLFELRHRFAKLMLADEVASQQEINGIIQCSATHTILFVFHLHIERLYIKVSLEAVDFIQNGKALRGFPVAVLFQITPENIANLMTGIQLVH